MQILRGWPKIGTIIRRRGFLLGGVLLLFVYNEYLHYYMVLLQCRWPSLGDSTTGQEPLRALVLADTHLLGSREGHWFDKLRREWQIEQAFQVSVSLLQPEAIFILGDLFDEGKWCSNEEFEYHVGRFRRIFRTPEGTVLVAVAGNHDIGFHYMIDDNKHQRFARAFNASSVRMITIKGNVFVLLNSMAFEGDRCSFCQEAEDSLKEIVQTLDCAQGKRRNCSKGKIPYSQPVLLQHFPLYRRSDSNCSGPDAADADSKKHSFKPKWACLAKETSNQLLDQLSPRLVLSGHTHHFCVTVHRESIPEWTVPSFSWRNKRNPSFLLVAINDSKFAIEKCYLPDEFTVIFVYILGFLTLFVVAIFHCVSAFQTRLRRHAECSGKKC